MSISDINKKLKKLSGGAVSATIEGDVLRLTGKLDSWNEVLRVCGSVADDRSRRHIVNDIECPEAPSSMRLPALCDSALEGLHPDVLVIGGGISGCSIARELTRWDASVLLVEKESDVALQASGRNDGEVHCGVDLAKKGLLKQKYVTAGNRRMDEVCRELEVPYRRYGQLVGFKGAWQRPLATLYAWYMRRVCGISDTRIIGRDELLKHEPGMNPEFSFALYNPSSACVCPYGLTIAYAENAIMNGASISLDTAVTGIETCDGRIVSVKTNRGTVYPRVVVNAAGVFAEDIARMAGDRFYSLHYRRGTNSILDKKRGCLVNGVAGIKGFKNKVKHTKGGGVLHTAHGNLLIGPDAVETTEREDFSTRQESIDSVFEKQRVTVPGISERDIITYFTGVRACTFEEDFVIEKGRKVKNLVHCAGIQSPGLTTAPAAALDVSRMAIEELGEYRDVKKNGAFNPLRKGIPTVRELPKEQREALIAQNPDYGVIVCRCEEISKGEILDALRSPLCVPTVDGIKKRVRPGMGRCQGGFCLPLVTRIIADFLGVPVSEVKKGSDGTFISFGPVKGEKR